MRYPHVGLVAITLLAVPAVGCHRQSTSEAPAAAQAAQSGVVRLVVDNENASDFDVFVIQEGGLRTRIGTANGVSVSQYTLRPDVWTAGAVRLVATPIGGGRTARSEPLNVLGGNTINFTIEPDARTSYATVR